MQSFNNRKFYSFRADANALGGYLEEPFEKVIPTLAPVSLPPVGGFAMARSEAFTFDEIVTCSSAYTRVSGQEHARDGSISLLVTAVVEDLNLLEVVRAERIVAQLSLSVSRDNGPLQVSVAGSGFEGLRLAGHTCHPKLNALLQLTRRDPEARVQAFTGSDVQQVGRTQAAALIQGFKNRQDASAEKWAEKRYAWMTDPQRGTGGGLCSLIDGVEVAAATESCGHIVEIPGFGRIILGELLVTRDSAQLIGIRAELGCPVQGQIGITAVGGGGSGDT